MDPAPLDDTWHLEVIAEFLNYVTLGDILRLIISMPPRCTKSLMCSVSWPVWSWVLDPKVQFLTASYDLDLAKRDTRKSRRVIDSLWFKERWGDYVKLSPDENMTGRYSNTKGGHRIAITSGGKTTGEGGDIILIDDAHNAREVYSDVKRNSILEWYDNAMRSRLNNQNTGAIVHVGQRTHEADVIGHVLKKEGRVNVEEDGRWVHLVLPNEYRPNRRCVCYLPKDVKRAKEDPSFEPTPIFEDPRREEGDLLNPGRLGKEATKDIKGGMSRRDYNSQYQQDPAADDGLILKKTWWQPWEYPEWHPQHHRKRDMPECEMIIQVYDTAFEEEEENDYSARTTWGIFEHTPEHLHPKTKVLQRGKPKRCAILVEAWRDKVAFPDLRREAIRSFNKHDPNLVLIEKKASGHSLRQELKQSGVRVKGVDPKGRDKVLRAHVSATPLEQGCIFYVPGHNEAGDVIDECSKFPVGEHDDYTDTVVMLLAYLRRMGSIEYFDEDSDDEINLFKPRERGIYG